MGHKRIKNIKPDKLKFTDEIFVTQATLDYHKFGPIMDYEIERIFDEFITETIASGFQRIMIITGKGQVVRPKVKRMLRASDKVKSFKYAGYFNGQDGAFEVELKN